MPKEYKYLGVSSPPSPVLGKRPAQPLVSAIPAKERKEEDLLSNPIDKAIEAKRVGKSIAVQLQCTSNVHM